MGTAPAPPARAQAEDPEAVAAARTAVEPAPAALADLTPEQRADRAARLIRAGEVPVARGGPGRAAVEQALPILDELIGDLAPGHPQRRRARFDRLVALYVLGEWEEVVESWRALQAEGIEVPPYAREVVAGALLAERRPADAREVYRSTLADDPDRASALIGLYYSLVESEEIGSAVALLDEAAADPRYAGDHLALARFAALGTAYGSHLAEAEERLSRLLERDPDDPALLATLGTVERWRGDTRSALERFERALALDPGNFEARLGRAGALMDLGHYEEVDAEAAALVELHPENVHVRRFARTWRLEQSAELVLDATAGDSDGAGASAFGGEDRTNQLWLHAPTFGHRWKPYLHLYQATAEFPEGEGDFRRAGVGVGYRGRNGFSLDASAHRGTAEGDGPGEGEDFDGLTLAVAKRVGDRLDARLRLETSSLDVPLRARRLGIDGEAADLSIGYRWNEASAVSASVSLLDMDDGNERLSALWIGQRRLKTTLGGYRLDGAVELYGSSNSRENAPYFNPDEDASAGVTVLQEWLGWRRYERSLTHRLVLSGGGYWQRGFDTEPYGVLRYEHDWRLDAGLGLRYALGVSSRVYDGNREERVWLGLSLAWKLAGDRGERR